MHSLTLFASSLKKDKLKEVYFVAHFKFSRLDDVKKKTLYMII